MQTAQKVITAYRHKRIIVCLLVALATLGATLAIRFISQRSVNEDYIRTAASQRVAALNDILRLPARSEPPCSLWWANPALISI